MSAPPSPRTAHAVHDAGRTKRRDRPPALDFPGSKPSSDGDVQHERGRVRDAHQPRLRAPPIVAERGPETESDAPRSASATSSLDPYYFGVSTPSDSPAPPLPTAHLLPRTPDLGTLHDPVTPGKDPASIDRRGLVGVGELATPRWARGERKEEIEIDEQVDELEEEEIEEMDDEELGGEAVVVEGEKDMPDSPWTIEAIDGDQDDNEEYLDVQSGNRSLRTKRSIADESGGEEILYPRQPQPMDWNHPMPTLELDALQPSALLKSEDTSSEAGEAVPPPSAFVAPANRARKRTSDEFEMDQNGTLVAKHASMRDASPSKEKDKAAAVRRHRSLGVGIPSATSPRDKAKERRRDNLSVNVKHSRHTSASSSSSSHGEGHHTRRVLTSDFSHLPPSPSSSSIQQFLRHASTGSAAAPPHTSPKDSHAAAHVAHSLLRGAQEGWSDMDDQATLEALRKLDGLSGKSARARSSVGGHSRMGSTSRPGTPAKGTVQWEGVPGSDNSRASRRVSAHSSLMQKEKDRTRDQGTPQRQPIGLGLSDVVTDGEPGVVTGEDRHGSPALEKPLKKSNSTSARSSFTPKRGSASSTTYTSTPTTSSRDSATLSTTTNATSVSGVSSRHSISSKGRRNSAGSDISSINTGDAAMARDRAAALAASTDPPDESTVPPVPPLPKDFSNYKHHSQNMLGVVMPASDSGEDKDKARRMATDIERQSSLELPSFPTTPSKHHSINVHHAPTPTHKTPSKKWSFTNALGKKLSSSPSVSSMKDSNSTKSSGLALSPRSLTFGQQLRKSTSKDYPLSPVPTPKESSEQWTAVNKDAMASASSLVSLSSIGSVRGPLSPPVSAPPPITSSRTPDRLIPSRSETASSGSTNLTAAPPLPQHAPLSPSSSIRRGPSSKRLTPSSIPFFRRSSSQSMQFPPSTAFPSSISPTSSTGPGSSHLRAPSSLSPSKDANFSSSSVSGTTHKKSSVLSLGLPSLLKGSSSRRSLHSDKEKSDAKSGKESEKEKHKKDDKDRSESRISVLMGRKRGKTLSSATPPKKTEPVAMPPMQISAIPPVTAQRVASLKSNSSTSLSSVQSATKTSSRLTSQTVSSMQKQSDASLRSRNQLPTIAGSPSVGALGHQPSKDTRDPPPSASLNTSSALAKETPTKIPRISSRSSAANSPTLKNSGAGRRTSTIMGSTSAAPLSRGTSPTAGNESMNEFGVLDNGQTGSKATVGTSSQRHSARASPSTTSSRVPRQVSAPTSSTVNGGMARKSNRDSMSFGGLRKASTGSVASIMSSAPNNEPQQSHHRFSALSPSKGLKLLAPKMSLPTARVSSSSGQSIGQAMASPSTSRQSLSTPSPAPSLVDEEELLGDEEMMQYIKRQQAKKLANGATQKELDDLLRFPEPTTPVNPMPPHVLLKSSQVQYLSEYECKEVLDYPSVYYIGANSDKKPATVDNTHNNHGYDDERGDYLVVNHDHLAYRYEVIDTLGKGSFGQVLHCRDHATGESVAIKIIRNKKRFHHQALVEIKILDNLRKWDQDEKHHVIKMTEHFYFRGHLCIAMELLSINLYELIKANGFVGFTTALIRRFTSQMLQSLALMRHHRIVHCDLKPENVLLRHPAKSAIKVIDFGSSCFEHEKIYTYIQSRFYRSPEVILGMNYHMGIDMWSLGCILAELYTGFPIFPGENEQEQLSCIMEVLGVPDKEFINRSSRKRLFFDTTGAPRPVVNSKGRRRRPGTKTLQQVLRCDDDLFVDFISKCLLWDPERRLKPQAALRHPFISAGRRTKVTSPSPSTAKTLLTSAASGLTSSRSSKVTETPKKSLISAPTPLTARTSRTTTGTVPTTPSNTNTMPASLGSARSYRSSQAQSMSYHSSRTMTAK